ncbi:CPBP family intramembrane glutamic endopeptidase [uncultured Neglectibacter sp.]|uniref:CPBP family intramembrane glutamic endopeptidase n=1 Tax=uncultured Neglectibacter sp. TaxID=1924108 RepID=UPI0034DEF42C
MESPAGTKAAFVKGELMEKNIKERPILSCAIIFALCGSARLAEYFVIRTDETVLAENFLHKVFGIVLLAIILHLLHSSWQSIGFTGDKILSGAAKGLLLGGGCFIAAYSIECLILYCINGNVSLAFYISGFSLSGETVKHNSPLFFLLCIAFNMINVWMEEGVFRGLFMKILSGKLSFIHAALLIAFLFGIWHWVMPFRDYLDGNASLANLLAMGIGYILLSGLMSIKWSLLYQMTGSLWVGLGDHLFNNVVVTNLLHVISNGEADSMQIVRIILGQLLSLFVVILYDKKSNQAKRINQ